EPEDRDEERAAEDRGEQEPLREIGPERPRRRPVEAEARLEDERRPPAEREPDERAPDTDGGDEEKSRHDRSDAERAHGAAERAEAAAEPERERDGEGDRLDDHAESCPRATVLARAPPALGLVRRAELGGRLVVAPARGESRGDEVEAQL